MSPRTLLDGAPPLVVTLWPSRTKPFGRRDRHTWPSFVETFIASPEIAIRKESIAGYAFVTFKDNRRALGNAEHVFALMFDLDQGDVSIDQAARLWRRTRAALYTTFSSTPAHPKLRIIIALSRPVSPEEHARLWLWAAKRFARAKITLDESTRDASRLWYIPSHKPGGTYEWRVLNGKPLDVPSLLRGAARAVLPGQGSVPTEAREAPVPRTDGAEPPASETLLGRAFTHAGMVLTDSRTDGVMFVTCPWEKRHTSAGDSSSTVVFPSESAAAVGHFHCLHQHCSARTARDVLRTLPAAAVAHARRDHGLEAHVRATVVGAWLESRPAWDARPPLVRWRLDLATRDGELLRANIVLPSPGYEHARTTFDAVFPHLRWSSRLASFDEWKRRGLIPLGAKLNVALRGTEVTSMRAAGGSR
jgi:hypothetical protein